MKRTEKVAALAAVVSLSMLLGVEPAARGADERGHEIAARVDAANSGFLSEVSSLQLDLADASGGRVTRDLSVHMRELNSDGDRSVVEFTAPSDVKGTKLLTWSHQTTDDDQWLYLPAIKRVKRISGSNKAGAFMGSEFSYEDLVNPELEEFDYRFIGEQKIDNAEVWVYERTPHDKDSGYKRQVLWVSKALMNPIKIEFYNRRDELLKVAQYGDFKRHGRFFRPNVVQMTNVQTKKRSTLRYLSLQLGQDVGDAELRPDTLGG